MIYRRPSCCSQIASGQQQDVCPAEARLLAIICSAGVRAARADQQAAREREKDLSEPEKEISLL